MILTDRWLPGAEMSIENMGAAKYLEDEYWRRTELAIANGIAKAFNG